jgi:filamentous hemagglutinin family protein
MSRRSTLFALLLGGTALVSPAAFAQSLPTGALPTDGAVRAGSASIGAPANGSLTVTQSSQRAVVDWRSFNVGAGNRVHFSQPGSNSAILNRVTGNTASNIAGRVSADGKVYLVNPNGIQITPTGNIDTKGGFVASTLNMANRDFMAGKDKFLGNGASKRVVNQGSIVTGPGGSVALIGGSVANEGTIIAPLGKVAMGAGEAATLDLNGDGFLQVAIPSNTTDAEGNPLVSNSGKIEAAGGNVELKAAAVRQALRDAVRMSGSIQAKSVSGQDGRVVLGGDAGVTVITGNIDVSGEDKGGHIDVAGAQIELRGASLDASGGNEGGLIRIGGAFQGGRPQDTTSPQAQKFVTRFGKTQAIASADSVQIDAGSRIDASARAGKGGTAIIWSEQKTTALGSIDASGPKEGGAIEVSSRSAIQSIALTRIRTGRGGKLLLDPKNINIVDDPGDGSVTFDTLQDYAFADRPGDTLTLKGSEVMDILSNGTDLTLQASNDITWVSGGGSTSGTPGHLTLEAGRSVIFAIDTQLNFLGGNLTITANNPLSAGVVDADRDAGNADIDVRGNLAASDHYILNGGFNPPSGSLQSSIAIRLRDGAGLTNATPGTVHLTQLAFSDVTLEAAPGGALKFHDDNFFARNITLTGNLQLAAGSIQGISAEDTLTWINRHASTVTATNGTVSQFVLYSLNGEDYFGHITGDPDAVRLDLLPGDINYSTVYGESAPDRPANVSVAINANSALQDFTGSDTASSILRTSGMNLTWAVGAGDNVGNYATTNAGFNGSLFRAGTNGSYLIDVRNYLTATRNLAITRRPVSVTAVNGGGFTYGSPNGNVVVTLEAASAGRGLILDNDITPTASFAGAYSDNLADIGGYNGATGSYAFTARTPAGNRSFTITGFAGAQAGNYEIDAAGSTLTAASSISPALLVPTVSAGSYTYGSPDALVTLSGILNGDTVAPQATVSGLSGTQAMADTGAGYAFDEHTAAGNRSYTLTGLGGAHSYNYTLDLSGTISETLTIAPKAIAYAACCGNVTSTYGALANLNLGLSGVLAGDDVAAATTITGSSGAVTLTARTPVGSYTVAPTGLSGAQAGNYTIAGAGSFTLDINARELTYTAPSGTVSYGTLFNGTIPVVGVLSGDDVTAALGIRSGGVTTAYNQQANAGSYQTLPMLGGADSGNYVLSGGSTPGALTINPLALDYVLISRSNAFGNTTLPTVDLTGVLFGDDVSATVNVAAPGGYVTLTPVGTYNASVTGLTGAKAGNYVLSSGSNGAVQVVPKELSYTVNATTTTYGDQVNSPTFDVALNGLVTTGEAVAIHPVLTIRDADGNTVAAASTDNTTFLGATRALLSNLADAGNYTVTLSLASNDANRPVSNYALGGGSDQPLVINKRPLTATIQAGAGGYSWAYGSDAQIGVTIDFAGFVAGVDGGIGRVTLRDSNNNVVPLGAACCGPNAPGQIAAAGLKAGSYSVTVTDFTPQGGAKTSNYVIASNTVAATITPKPLTYSMGSFNGVYGTLATPSGSLSGVFGSDAVALDNFTVTDIGSITTALAARTNAGTYTLRATGLTGADAANYTLAAGGNTAGTLTVAPKTLTWRVTDTSSTYGSTNALAHMGTISFDGVLSGDAVGGMAQFFRDGDSPGAGSSPITIDRLTDAGTYKMFVTSLMGAGLASINYRIDNFAANTPGTLTVAKQQITVDLGNTFLTYGDSFTGAQNFTYSGTLHNGEAITLGNYVFNLGNGDVGTYALSGQGFVNGNVNNYDVTVNSGDIRIAPLELQYSVGNRSWIYGDFTTEQLAQIGSAASFRRRSDGADYPLESRLPGGVSFNVSLFGTAVTLNQRSSVGTYAVRPVVNSANYKLIDFGSQDGAYTITPRALTVFVHDAVYGDRPAVSINNLVTGDFIGADTVLTGSTGAYNTSALWTRDGKLGDFATPPPVDSYALSDVRLFTDIASGTYTGNYTIGAVSRTTIQVTPRPIRAIAMDTVTITYGDKMVRQPASGQAGTDIFPNAVTYENLVRQGDGQFLQPMMFSFPGAPDAGTYEWSTDGTERLGLAAISNGGRSEITCVVVGCINRNYKLVDAVPAKVVVNPRPLTYTIQGGINGVYGGTAPVTVTLDLKDLPFVPLGLDLVLGVMPGQPSSLDNFIGRYAVTGSSTNGSSQNGTLTLTFNGFVGSRFRVGSYLVDVESLTGADAKNFTITRNTLANAAAYQITPKSITYSTEGGVLYSGIGGIDGSMDKVGRYSLTGVLSGDTVTATLQLLRRGAAGLDPRLLSTINRDLAPGDYDITVASLGGTDGVNYSLTAGGNQPGLLTSVDLGILNGLTLLNDGETGSLILATARAAARNAAQNTSNTTTTSSTSPSTGNAEIDALFGINLGGQSDGTPIASNAPVPGQPQTIVIPAPPNALAPPPPPVVPPAPPGAPQGTDVGRNESTVPTDPSQCGGSAGCIFLTIDDTVGNSIDGNVAVETCSSNGVCVSGGAGYESTNQISTTSIITTNQVTAETSVGGNSSCGSGNCSTSASVSTTAGADVSAGLIRTANSMTMAAEAAVGAGAAAEGSVGYHDENGGVDAGVGVSVGQLGGGGSVSSSYEDGMLSVSMNVSLEIGIGIDLSLGFSINVQNFDEAFNGWTTSYVEFVDPAAAQARADRAVDLSQQLANMVIYQQKIVSDVLAGGYNANPDAIAQIVVNAQAHEQLLRNTLAQEGFGLSSSNGQLALTDQRPPATRTVYVNHDGVFDAIAGIF